VKYNQSRIGDQTIFNTWKNNFRKHLQYTLQTSHINENNKKQISVFDIYFTEFGAALTTVLPVLFKYCYTYCYNDNRKLSAVVKGGGLAL
jgi:hypothetical protein